MILVDSGFLIALIDPGDELHGRAEAWVGHLDEPLILTEYVWLEVYNFFSATPMRDDVDDLLEQMVASADCQFVEISPDLRNRGRQLYRDRSDKRWSSPTAFRLSSCKRGGFSGHSRLITTSSRQASKHFSDETRRCD